MTGAQQDRRSYIRALYLELETVPESLRARQTPKYLALVAEIRSVTDAFRLAAVVDGDEGELELQLVEAQATVETLQQALRQRRTIRR